MMAKKDHLIKKIINMDKMIKRRGAASGLFLMAVFSCFWAVMAVAHRLNALTMIVLIVTGIFGIAFIIVGVNAMRAIRQRQQTTDEDVVPDVLEARRKTMKRYFHLVIVEAVAISVISIVTFNISGWSVFFVPLVVMVVGLHIIPFAWLFNGRTALIIGPLIAAIGIAGLLCFIFGNINIDIATAYTAAATAPCLTAHGIYNLVVIKQTGTQPSSPEGCTRGVGNW